MDLGRGCGLGLERFSRYCVTHGIASGIASRMRVHSNLSEVKDVSWESALNLGARPVFPHIFAARPHVFGGEPKASPRALPPGLGFHWLDLSDSVGRNLPTRHSPVRKPLQCYTLARHHISVLQQPLVPQLTYSLRLTRLCGLPVLLDSGPGCPRSGARLRQCSSSRSGLLDPHLPHGLCSRLPGFGQYLWARVSWESPDRFQSRWARS